MSEEIEKKLVGITPIFQNVLIKQVDKIMDALDRGDYFGAYLAEKTLIGAFSPDDKEPLQKEFIQPIDRQLASCTKVQGSNEYKKMRQRVGQHNGVLARRTRPLYEKIMETLHNGNYLRLIREVRQGQELT